MQNKKKLIIAGGILLVLAASAIIVGAIGLHRQFAVRGSGYGKAKMMGRGNVGYPAAQPTGRKSQFIVPQDALKSGELALAVNDLDSARQKVTEVAGKNSGSVYSTFIAYASDSIKNGSIVIQVPADKFDAAFGDLKNIGFNIIQESTQQIAPPVIYPMMQSAPVSSEAGVNTPAVASDQEAASESDTDTANASIEPTPATLIYPQPYTTQDKGYIRVIFADYGTGKNAGFQEAGISAGGMMGQAYLGQNMRGNLWVVLGIKMLLLIALLGVLVFMLKKTFHNFRSIRRAKHTEHSVRQAPRTRARVIRIKK